MVSPYAQPQIPASASKLHPKPGPLSLPPVLRKRVSHSAGSGTNVGGFGGLNELLTDRQSDEARMKQKMTQYHTVQKRMAKSAKQRREHESTYKEELAMEKLRKEKEEITRRKREGEERLKKMREERLKREALRKKKEEAELLKQSKRTYARQRDMHKMNEERWSEFEEHLPDVIEYKDVPWPYTMGHNNILGLPPTAKPEKIRSAFKVASLRWHPDKFSQIFGEKLAPADKDAIMERVEQIAMRIVEAKKQLPHVMRPLRGS
mmetsp:Transcript_44570/g.115900  ORF Transcript_44570/g.115900 Transcript_44570/m.115900 type:complete len:263 (-) Transcript_44570:227-1015(-)|eukprot:CAMPEP_0113879338 /NCGR_PEP_ID=MMETSP0780_2-20120614/7184_1 /TAXON_ID=652834 /ORGANISM="Palpitomonas bilix" /LENGTH=262 /DNA_ID=CAMNT_0000865911 /DNA_START=296 /DNA_END=1084 /DNA_ORIENTATION=- /assembly_acc=CAM_ASM_000599